MTDFNALVSDMTPAAPAAAPAAPNDNTAPVAQPEPISPMAPQGKFSSLVDSVAADRQTQAEAINASLAQVDPAKQAQAIDLGKQYGLPAAAVMPNLGDYAAKAALQKDNDILRNNPTLTAWVTQNPDAAGTAKGSFDSLHQLSLDIQEAAGNFGKSKDAIEDGWSNAFKTDELGRLGSEQILMNDLGIQPSAERTNAIADLQNDLSQGVQQTGIYKKLSGISGFAGSMVDNFMQGALPGAAAGGAVGAVAGGIGAAPGAAIGAGIGFKADMARIAAGNTYLSLKQLQDSSGNKISDGAAQVGAIFSGLGTYALAGIGEGKVTDMAAQSFMRDATTQALQKPAIQNAFASFAANLGKSSLSFGALNLGMEGSQLLGEQIAREVSPGDFATVLNDPKQRQDAINRLVEAGENGLLLGPIAHLTMGAAGAGADLIRARMAKDDAGFINNLADQSASNPVRATSPDSFRSFMQSQTDGTPVENMYAPASRVAELYQQKGVTPGPDDGILGKAVPDIATQLQQATPRAGDIVIPTADYATHVAGTDVDTALRPDLRARVDGMSANEAKEYESRYADIVQQFDSNFQADQQRSAPLQTIQDMAAKAATDTGIYTPAQAAHIGALEASRYSVLGEQFQTNPLDLFNQMGGLTGRRGVEGEGPEAVQPPTTDVSKLTLDDLEQHTRAQLAGENQSITGMLDYLRNPPKVDKGSETLTQFLKRKGGLKDEGGDLAAMDARKGAPGLIRKNGMTLDKAREAAVEAGYLKDNDTANPDQVDTNSLLESIRQDLAHKNVRADHAVNEDQNMKAVANDFDRVLSEHGIYYTGRSNEDVVSEMADKGLLHSPHEFNQAALSNIKTPEFKEWFGKSKVVDEKGKPLVVYHGSGTEIPEFKYEYTNQGNDQLGSGFYFTDSKNEADNYQTRTTVNGAEEKLGGTDNPTTHEVYLSIKKPLDAEGREKLSAKQIEKIIRDAPDLEDRLSDWGDVEDEGADKLIKEAAQAYATHTEPSKGEALRSLFKLARDFYPDDIKSFNESVRDATGYDGVVQNFRAPDKAHYVAWFPEQIKSVDNRGTFSANDARIHYQGTRGKISIDSDYRIITAFQNADRSTGLHELGHSWLEEMKNFATREDAPEQLQKDWATVKDAIGYDGKGDIPTESHETFARMTERYLMEGKAPSVALRSAFRAFKNWLMRIYRSVQSLDAPISDEMRGVFDRMLATDEEIGQIEQRDHVNTLFRNKDQAGMSDAEFAAYIKTGQNAQDAAREQLLTEAMEDIRKQNTREWNAADREIRPGIEADIAKQQDMRTLNYFRNGKYVDENGAETNLPSMKMSKAAVQSLYPDQDIESRLPKAVTDTLVKTDGIKPDELAPFLGYDSGKAMIDDMADLGQVDKSIKTSGSRQKIENYLADQQVNAKLSERFGASADELKQRAEELVGGPSRMDLKLAELRAMGRKTGQMVSFTKENMADWATTQISAMAAKDAANTFSFVRAIAKAGREAQRAVERGDDHGAFQSLQRQALNMAMAQKAREFEKVYNRGLSTFKYLASKATIKSADQSYLDQVHGVLRQFGFGVNRSDQELNNALADKPLQGFVMDKRGLGRDVETADFLFDRTPTEFKRLTTDQFQGLKDTIDSLMHNARDEQTITVNGKKLERQKVIDQILQNLDSFDKRPKSEFLNPEDQGSMRFGLDKFTSLLRSADAELLKPEQFLDWLDKRDIMGPLNSYVFRPIKDAQIMEMDLLRDKAQGFKNLEMPKEWNSHLTDEVPNETLLDPDTGNAARMSRKTMLAIALNTGNASNLKKLADGYHWKSDEVMEFLHQNMTKADWDFAQHSWDTFESLWPQIAELQRRTTGIAPDKIEATPIQTKHGEYRGGYYPVVYDPNKSQVGGRNLAANGIFDSDYYRPTTSKGHTISRLENFTDKLSLNLDIMPWKLKQAVHDVAFREALVNADKILSDPRFTAALNDRWGPEYAKEFRPWLKDIANQPNADNRPASFIDNVLRYSRMTMVEMGVGFRLTTMAKHGLTALANSVGEIGPDAMRQGVQEYFSDPNGKQAWVFERSGEMRNRMAQYDRDIRENMSSMMGGDSVLTQMRRFGHYGVSHLDMMSALPTWIGSYRKALADGLGESDAVYAADKTVRNAHGAQSSVDLAGIQRGPEYKKLFTMFYGFFNHMYNRQRDIVRRAGDAQNGMDVAKVMGKTLAYVAVPALVEQAISGQGGPDKDGWGKWAAKSIAGQLAATLPLVRDVASYLEYGKGTETPMSRMIEAMGNEAKDMGKFLEGQQASQKWVKHAVETPGYILGAPTGQLATSAQFLWDVDDGKENPQDLQEWVHGLMYGTAKGKQ